WKCTWSASGNGVYETSTSSSTITAGLAHSSNPTKSSDSGNVWKLYNRDEGEIEMHWDWSWDE
ncbi:MAG: hypothetical protein J6Y60_03140, partial [Treponema sp.]|nr:hypothetical protein [Treponema sp.]